MYYHDSKGLQIAQAAYLVPLVSSSEPHLKTVARISRFYHRAAVVGVIRMTWMDAGSISLKMLIGGVDCVLESLEWRGPEQGERVVVTVKELRGVASDLLQRFSPV